MSGNSDSSLFIRLRSITEKLPHIYSKFMTLLTRSNYHPRVMKG